MTKLREFLRPPGMRMSLGKTPATYNEPVFNKTVTAIQPGSLVVLDTTNMPDNSAGESYPGICVTTSTTVADPKTYGVASSLIPAGGKGFVTRFGVVKTALKGNSINIAVGDRITTGAAAGYGYKADGSVAGGKCVGFALTATTADSVLGTTTGYVTVFVDCISDVLASLTATVTELNKLAGVTAGSTTASKALVVGSSSQLNVLTITNPKVAAGVALAVGGTVAGVAGATNVCTVTVQLKDGGGTNLTYPAAVDIYLSDAAAGGALSSSAPSTGFGSPSAGGIISNLATSKMAIRCLTDATGKVIIPLTDTGATHYYVCAVTPVGITLVSVQLGSGSYGT